MMRLKPCYATAEFGDVLSIHAYTAAGESLKQQFLRDGRTYFLAVAKAIQPHGFASLGVHANPAGVAVSGEVGFKAWNEVRQQGVALSLSATSLAVDRTDRLALIVNELSQRVTRGTGKHAQVDFKLGLNRWLSANLDPTDLAQQVLTMLRVESWVGMPQAQLALFDEAAADVDLTTPPHSLRLTPAPLGLAASRHKCA